MHDAEAPRKPSPPRGAGGSVVLYAALMLLSVGGVAVMDFSETWGLEYWLVTTIVFAITGVILALRHAGASDEGRSLRARRQIAHWLAVTLGILLVFLLERSEGLPSTSAGMIALLVLALGTILAGIHYEWRLVLLGLLLALTFVAAVFAEQFFWVMLVPVIVAAAVLVIRGRRATR